MSFLARLSCALITASTALSGAIAGTVDPLQQLVPSDNTDGGFGSVIDTSGQYMIIGAPEHNGNAGGFEIYAWSNDAWVLEATSTPSDYDPGDEAGFAVAVTGDGIAMIGLPGRGSGAVEVWTRSPEGNWSKHSDLPWMIGDRFGAAIDVDGMYAVVGAPQGNGHLLLYEYNASWGMWNLVQAEEMPDGPPNKNFGHAVAIENYDVYVSAPGYYGGRVMKYTLSGGWLIFDEMLSSYIPWQAGRLGDSIAVHNGIVVISAPDMASTDSVGSIWVLSQYDDGNGIEWDIVGFGWAPSGLGAMDYGAGMAMFGHHVMIGAPGYEGDSGLIQGYEIIWDNEGGPPAMEYRGTISGSSGDRLGAAIATNHVGFAAGAPGGDSGEGNVCFYSFFTAEDAPPDPVPLQAATVIELTGDGQVQAVDIKGDLAVTGRAPANNGAGGLTVLRNDGASWSEVALVAGAAEELMGYSVAVCDGWVVAGCPGMGSASGTVRTWAIDADNALAEHETLSPFTHPNAKAGFDVDLHRRSNGDVYLIVGAPGVSTQGDDMLTYGGFAVYYRSPADSEWTMLLSETAPHGGSYGCGYAVALGETPGAGTVSALVGLPFYDYENPVAADSGEVLAWAGTSTPESWSQITGHTAWEFGGRLGSSIDVDGEWFIVGQPGSTDSHPQGSARVQTMSDVPESVHILTPDEDAFYLGFGSNVAIDSSGQNLWAAVGVPYWESPRTPGRGAVDVFTQYCHEPAGPCYDWVRHSRTQPMDIEPVNRIGGRVALNSGHLLFSNGPEGNSAPNPMLAYMPIARTSGWIGSTGGDFNDPNLWNIYPEEGGTFRFSLLESVSYPVFLPDQTPSGHIEIAFDAPIFVPDNTSSLIEMESLKAASDPMIRAASFFLNWGQLNLESHLVIGDSATGDAANLLIGAVGKLHVGGVTTLAEGGSLNAGVGLGSPDNHIWLETDSVSLKGSVRVWIEPEAAAIAQEGDHYVLARSATTPASGNDRFATVVLPGLPNDLAFQLTYGPPPGIAGGGPWEAAIEVVSLSGLLGFDDPSSLPVTGTPIAMEVVDLTGDGAEEICVAFAGVPGQLVIFENDGAGGITQQVVLNTGADPTSLASGDWDADGRNDLAVGHDGGDVYVLLNDDNDPSNGFALQTLTGEGPVTCLTRANINFDAPLDIIAGIADTDGDGSGRWQWWLGQTAFRGGGLGGGDSIDTPGNPVIIDPSENEDQKDYIAAGILGTGRAVILKNLLGAQGLSQSTWVVGADPRDIDLADLDGDGIRDIVATSAANGNIALLLGAADPGNFDNALFIPVGSEPSGIAAHDFDGDGNVDLAAVVVNDDGGRIVRVLQNEGGLSFTTVDTAQGESPVLLSLGDINGDGNDQLVTVGSATSLSGEETTVALRDVTQIDCPGDVDSNGVVNIEDLLAVISQFGNDCEGGESCWADCDDNGMINIEDLLVVIGGFGNCDG